MLPHALAITPTGEFMDGASCTKVDVQLVMPNGTIANFNKIKASIQKICAHMSDRETLNLTTLGIKLKLADVELDNERCEENTEEEYIEDETTDVRAVPIDQSYINGFIYGMLLGRFQKGQGATVHADIIDLTSEEIMMLYKIMQYEE